MGSYSQGIDPTTDISCSSDSTDDASTQLTWLRNRAVGAAVAESVLELADYYQSHTQNPVHIPSMPGQWAPYYNPETLARPMRNYPGQQWVHDCLQDPERCKGVPMFYMGDEYGHTKGGNNNTYCHDHYVNYFRWDKKKEQSSDLYRFCRLMTKFRKECESLGLEDFPTSERLQWHGHQPGKPDWSEASRFVAFTMKDETKGEIYVAFNTSHLPVVVGLPERPGFRWDPVVDTGKEAPYDILTDSLPDRAVTVYQFSHFLNSNLYPMLSYSSIILVLHPDV